MKTQSLILATVLALGFSARSAVPEDCWTTTRSHVAGQFAVSMDTSKFDKDQLLSTLAKFSTNTAIYAMGFPLVLADSNYINFVIAPSGVWTRYNSDGTVEHESQQQIEANVDPVVKNLMALPGVTINCFNHAVPHPGVGISNAAISQ